MSLGSLSSPKSKKPLNDMSWAPSHAGRAGNQSKTGPFSKHGTGLPLVKLEYKIGPATYFDAFYGIRWIGIPATSYRCPHCGHLLHADFWSGMSDLVPESGAVCNAANNMMMAQESGPNFLSEKSCAFAAHRFLPVLVEALFLPLSLCFSCLSRTGA